jgi:S-DNA-T family DNA segregation ATPase FtsK/SpoIIIE
MASKKKNSSKPSGTAQAKVPQKPRPEVSKGLHLNLSTKLKEEILGILTMTVSALLILAIVSHRPNEQPGAILSLWHDGQLQNFLSVAGAYVSHYLVAYTFGYPVMAVPILFFVYGWLFVTHKSIFLVNQFAFYILTLMILVSAWIALPDAGLHEQHWEKSGLLGGMIAAQAYIWLGGFGSILVWVVLSLLWLILVTRISIADLIPSIQNIFISTFRHTSDTIGRFKNRQKALLDAERKNEALIPQYLQAEDPQREKTETPAEPPVVESKVTSEVKTSGENLKVQPEETQNQPVKEIVPSAVLPETEDKNITGVGVNYDTALLNDIKALGHIDKQFAIPSIHRLDGEGGEKKESTEEKKPEQAENEIPRTEILPEDEASADASGVDFKDVARNAFEEEHASVATHDEERITASETDANFILEEKEAAKENRTGDGIDSAGTFRLNDLKKNLDAEVSEEAVVDKVKAVKLEKEATEIDFDKENQAARKRYRQPSLDLLEPTQEMEKLTESEIRQLDEKIHQIISTLAQFGIDTKVVATEYNGPVVAIYQLELPTGLKISKITGLEDELALSMKVKSVRMVPVTSKGTIQVEIPKPKASPVLIRSLFEDKSFRNAKQKYRLGLALGKTIDGQIHFEDLAKMPHLLIAGTTGSGKSVGVNSMITSLLYQFDPSEVKFVMIDPKKVELALYRKLKNHHLICLRNPRGEIIEDVVTKPDNAKLLLKALVEEMEDRYERLAHANVRNIEDYNKRWDDGTMPDDGKFDHSKLEYIVAIIDELADLMMTAPREVETSITRLAQMARAVGIHLIVATQRPSVDVLTGLIKANFPARIAYQVRSKIDSRTILDMGGAELLLGKGDMLYLPPGQMPIRIQNAFTSTKETESIVDYIARMPAFPRKDFVVKEEPRGDVDGNMEAGSVDVLFNEALEIVVKHNQGSASLLQRRLSIGYARAARIVDQLEKAGVVSGQDGGKARQVLITEDQIAMYRV